MDMMTAHHTTTIGLLNQNRAHSDQRFEDLVSRFDREIPDGHGVYHRKLIEEAARRQALRDAMRHKVMVWVLGAVLTAVSAYFADVGKVVAKAWNAVVK